MEQIVNAVYNGYIDIIRNRVNKDNVNSVVNHSTLLIIAITQEQSNIVKLLIEKGADIDQCKSNRIKPSPLMMASYFRNKLIVQLLIESKCNLNQQNSEGNTALHYSLCYSHNTSEKILIGKILMKAGVDPYIQNNKGETYFKKAETYLFPLQIKMLKRYADMMGTLFWRTVEMIKENRHIVQKKYITSMPKDIRQYFKISLFK